MSFGEGYLGSPFPNCRRCPMCGIEWPYDPITMGFGRGDKAKNKKVGFMQCASCGADTKPYRTQDDPPSAADAAARIRQVMFDRYYEAHEDRRTGDSPDDIGRMEGRVLAEKLRQEWDELRQLREMWNLDDAEEPVL